MSEIKRYNNSLNLSHVVEAQQFDRETILNNLFPLVDRMKANVAKGARKKALRGYQVISWFEESSTRTAASFALAVDWLGGKIVYSTENAKTFSSRAKGESIEDTIRILSECYHADIVVGRFANNGDAVAAASVAVGKTFIVNAGDGDNQHPTQALLDMYTIHEKFERLDNLTIGLVGDLANGRTVKSLAYLCGKFEGIKLYLVSPEQCKLDQGVKDYLNKHHVFYEEADDLRPVAQELDVLYVTRPQLERDTKLTEADMEPGRFSVDQTVLAELPDEAIVLHPLPRTWELPTFVDIDLRACYFEQAENGLYMRMALLKMISHSLPKR